MMGKVRRWTVPLGVSLAIQLCGAALGAVAGRWIAEQAGIRLPWPAELALVAIVILGGLRINGAWRKGDVRRLLARLRS
jgi:hypothetical protein